MCSVVVKGNRRGFLGWGFSGGGERGGAGGAWDKAFGGCGFGGGGGEKGRGGGGEQGLWVWGVGGGGGEKGGERGRGSGRERGGLCNGHHNIFSRLHMKKSAIYYRSLCSRAWYGGVYKGFGSRRCGMKLRAM